MGDSFAFSPTKPLIKQGALYLKTHAFHMHLTLKSRLLFDECNDRTIFDDADNIALASSEVITVEPLMMWVQPLPSRKSPKIRQFYTFFVNNLENKPLAIFVQKINQLLNNFLGRLECCNLTILVEFHKIGYKITKASFELYNSS